MRGLVLGAAAAALLASALGVATAPAAAAACPTGVLVDAAFRDAGLAALQRLTVQAPGQAADGAVRVHQSAGYVDPQGGAWHHVSAYQVNLAFVGALRVAPDMKEAAGRWLQWQARHMETAGLGAARGVVLDHWLRAPDLSESTCPPGLAPALCNEVDAFDSTAASTLLMADAYVLCTGGAALLRQPHVRPALEAAAATLRAADAAERPDLGQARPPVAYTDGRRRGARRLARLGGDPARRLRRAAVGARHLDFVRRGEAADCARGSGTRSSACGGSMPAPSPPASTTGIRTPSPRRGRCSGTASPIRSSRCARASPGTVPPTAWRGADGWAVRNVDPAGFWWPAVAVAAHCTGDTESARTWVQRAPRALADARGPLRLAVPGQRPAVAALAGRSAGAGRFFPRSRGRHGARPFPPLIPSTSSRGVSRA